MFHVHDPSMWEASTFYIFKEFGTQPQTSLFDIQTIRNFKYKKGI